MKDDLAKFAIATETQNGEYENGNGDGMARPKSQATKVTLPSVSSRERTQLMKTAAHIRRDYWKRQRKARHETRTGWFWARREELMPCRAWKSWPKNKKTRSKSPSSYENSVRSGFFYEQYSSLNETSASLNGFRPGNGALVDARMG